MVALQKQRSEGQSFGGGPVNGLACLQVLHCTSPLHQNTKNVRKNNEKHACDKISWMASVEVDLWTIMNPNKNTTRSWIRCPPVSSWAVALIQRAPVETNQLNQSESNVSETSRKNDVALLGMSRVMIVSWMLLGLESIWSVAEAFANLSQQLYVHTRGMAVWYILGVKFQVLITITLPSLAQGRIRDRNCQCL